MSSLPVRFAALQEAVVREAETARDLAETLCQVRSASENREPGALEDCLGKASAQLAALSRAGAARTRLAGEGARALGLPVGSPLSAIAEVLSGEGVGLRAVAADLRRALGALARVSATLGICTRYGAAVSAHLLELRRCAAGGAASYGPNGRVGAVPRRLACRA